MDGTRPPLSAGGDRLSELDDRVLGHVLSFLPADEAARAALLSSRWRDIFAAVHTVSLEEPVAPFREEDYYDRYDMDSLDGRNQPSPDANAPPPFPCTVSNALLARGRRRCGAAPLRALRVAIDGDECPRLQGSRAHSTTVDQWVSYAVQQAAPEGLRLDLRLARVPLCKRYSVHHKSPPRRRRSLESDTSGSEDSRRRGSISPSPDRRSISPSPSPLRRRRRSPVESDTTGSDEEPRSRRRRSISSSSSLSPSPNRRWISLSPSPEPFFESDTSGSEDSRRRGSISPSPDRREISPSPLARRRRRRRSSVESDTSGSEEPPSRRRRSISSNEGSPDSPTTRPLRSICSNEGSSDYDYAGDRAVSSSSPRPHTGSSRRPSPRERYPTRSPSSLSSSSDDTVFCPSPRGHDEEATRRDRRRPWWQRPAMPKTMPTVLFTCADLRSLSLGHCRLAPPTKVDLPSLETLLLSHVSDHGEHVERVIAGSPSLADLTLEACKGVVTLHVPTCARLRRLAIRCCHRLTTVVLEYASELVAFEYRGAVPTTTFLTLHGGSSKVAYCKVDICGKEVNSMEEVTRLGVFLQLFANTQHLHLESARLGSGINEYYYFPTLSALRHLELRGRVPSDDTVVVGAVSSMLEHAPNLQTLSLIFHPEEHDQRICSYNEEELLDAHHLKYNGPSVSAVPSAAMAPCCLGSSVREINLVHYQGVRAQRALAKFLLCNAPVIDKLWCVFAQGSLWTQTQLMREIKGWVMNKSATTQQFL